MYRRKSSALFAAAFAATSMAPVLPAAAAQLGPPPGATLSIEELSKIDDFFNAEDATGRLPGAIVLIQHHGRPVSAKASLSLLDAMRPSAYGIDPVHYIFIIWLQHVVYD
jgi:hypothetical protein